MKITESEVRRAIDALTSMINDCGYAPAYALRARSVLDEALAKPSPIADCGQERVLDAPEPAADILDAARYRHIIDDALSGDGDFTNVQPSGYNGGNHVWIEFGFEHPQWTKFTKKDVDAAIDADAARGSLKA